MNLCYQFGRVVKEVRESHGWTQEVLADHAKLNRSYLGEVERGSVVPSIITIAKIAKALGVSASDLVARSEERESA
jgi:transcriptional regulator with XRE-family HTH domain